MKINEISEALHLYHATVRVDTSTLTVTARTTVTAETMAQARAMLSRIFGHGNVLSVSQVSLNGCEIVEATKIPNPDAQRLKAIGDQAKRLQQQARQMKARNKLQKAQTALNKSLAASQHN